MQQLQEAKNLVIMYKMFLKISSKIKRLMILVGCV